ncbi:MAG: hypothetical protein K2O02_03140 [Lachnospiraceae bacterium]|nr:hypothetical protein [Lachnospiraceae bacterium]
MADIRKVLETRKNGLKVNLFEFDIEDEDNFNNIKAYLINKVKGSKVHNIEEYDLTYYGAKNLNPAFVAKFNEQVAKINIPKKTSIPQFDVRRERVTEWMAQHLLEQMYGCIFYDEADKRLNLKTVEIDKHTDGIDVPGIWVDDDRIRFVICEVKASQEKQIPCSSIGPLQNDIQKAIDNADNRVSREILQYMHGIRNIKMQDDLLQRIINFLARLIAGEKKDLADNLMFFPFLLRNNEKIIDNQNMDDYRDFLLQRVKEDNVENIVAAFGKDFSEFSSEIYEKAIGD